MSHILRVKDFKDRFPEFKKTVEFQNPQNMDFFISRYSACSGIPLVVLYRFIQLVQGRDEKWEGRIAEYTAYYDTILVD